MINSDNFNTLFATAAFRIQLNGYETQPRRTKNKRIDWRANETW